MSNSEILGKSVRRFSVKVGLTVLATAILLAPSAQAKKLNVSVSYGYYGNTWMEQNRNMMTALSKSKDYSDKIDFDVQVAGADAQKQVQQINAMVEAGADVILLYPVSGTALNRAIRNACSRGIVVATWDTSVTEPCAVNVHADNEAQARHEAQWIADSLKGKGNVLMVSGVTGTEANDLRVSTAKKVWAKYPDIKVVAEVDGRSSDPVVREQVSKLMAVRKWSDFDAVFTQLGCFSIYSLQDEAGIPDEKKIPCAGSAENGERLAIASKGTTAPGANGTYRPMGIRGYTFEVGPIMGAKTMALAIDAKLTGKKLPHDVIVPAPTVTQDQVKLCVQGTWAEMKSGCNTFPPALMPNPETSSAIYDASLPQLGLKAALKAVPEY